MKNSTLVAILIGIVALFVLGMYTYEQYPIFSTVAMTGTCAEVQADKTNGAGQGECFIKFTASAGKVYYVMSTQEKVSNRAVTPAYPEGTRTTCLIDYCYSCWKEIFTCSSAKAKDSSTVQLCKKDSECFSERCVNGYCKEGGPTTCTEGKVYCVNPTFAVNQVPTAGVAHSQYKKCLPNGRYSGILQCPSGTSCKTDVGCVSPSTTDTTDTGTGTSTGTGTTAGYGSSFPEIPMQYLYIGAVILIVIVVLSFTKKK